MKLTACLPFIVKKDCAMSNKLSLSEILVALIITAVLCAPQAMAQFSPFENLNFIQSGI